MEAHLVFFFAAGQPAKRALDNERAEMLAVDFCKNNEDVGKAPVGNPHFLAVQHEAAVALPRGSCLGAERVRS